MFGSSDLTTTLYDIIILRKLLNKAQFMQIVVDTYITVSAKRNIFCHDQVLY